MVLLLCLSRVIYEGTWAYSRTAFCVTSLGGRGKEKRATQELILELIVSSHPIEIRNPLCYDGPDYMKWAGVDVD